MSQRNSSVSVWIIFKILLALILVNDPTASSGSAHHHGSAMLAFTSNLQHSRKVMPTSCKTTTTVTTTFQSIRQSQPCNRHHSNNNNQVVVPFHMQTLLLAHQAGYDEDAPLSSLLSDASLPQEPMLLLSEDPLPGFGVVPIIVLVAVGLFIAAQTSINQQLQGDQGLGAFLKDGRGFKGSAFRLVSSKSPFFKDDSERAVSSGSGNDPLPWLSLPQLDFVEVAGQKERLQQQQKQQQQQDAAVAKEEQALQQLEVLRLQMNEQLQKGNIAKATAIRSKLEQIMKDSGIEFKND